MNEFFRRFAKAISTQAGKPFTFLFAVTIVIVWALVGPTFGYSTTWQLFINTTTTIVTFLMVFVIQNTQNRDSKAMHLKLDELLKTNKEARNRLVAIEDGKDDKLDELGEEFTKVRERFEKRDEKKIEKDGEK